MQNFKKGSIVPRRLGIVVADDSKNQHLAVFLQDCTWDGRQLRSVEPARRMIAVRVHKPGRRMNNGTRKRVSLSVNWFKQDYLEDGRGIIEPKP